MTTNTDAPRPTDDATPMPCPMTEAEELEYRSRAKAGFYFTSAAMGKALATVTKIREELIRRAPDATLAAARTALEGVSIMLATELRSYRDEPWAKRVLAFLSTSASSPHTPSTNDSPAMAEILAAFKGPDAEGGK